MNGIDRIVEQVTKRVSLCTTHPNLFRALLTIAVMNVALALNFFFSKPTFNPYGIPRQVVGSIFLALGVSKLFVLTVYHNLRLVRLVVACSVGFMLFWGVSNTQQSFAGKSSFQLPILYVGLAVLQLPLLLEPPINPVTGNGNGKKLNGD